MKSSAKPQKSDRASEKSFHMTPKQFREYGRAVVDWIADYYEQVESLPVLSQVQPGQIRAALPAEPPEQGEKFEAILAGYEPGDFAGGDALAVAEFFRLFSGECIGSSDFGGLAFRGAGRAGNAVGDESGMHGTGNAGAGLAGGNAGICRRNSCRRERAAE